MGLFDKLFGSKPGRSSHPFDDKPPIFGGDGTSPEEAVIVNCASMGMANNLIDRFLSERHGTKDQDWKRGVEMFLRKPGEDPPSIRSISVETSDGSSRTYYFNVGRPMGATMKLIDMMQGGKLP